MGKPLVCGASFSDHASFFESMLSIRSPIGIGIGPVLVSLGFESSKYSFEATIDTLTSYFGSGLGPILFFDLSKMIKIGGDKLGKYFILGSANFDHRSYILKTVDVPADSTVVIEKPINLGAGDKLETQASANGDIDVFASILEIT